MVFVYFRVIFFDFPLFFTGDRLATFPLPNNGGSNLARVRSPWYNRSADGYGKCLKFRYMLLGAGKNSLRLYQIDDIFSRERRIWQDESIGDNFWRYGQVSISGVTQHQVKRALQIFQCALSNSIRSQSLKDQRYMPDNKLLSETFKTKSIKPFLVRFAAYGTVTFFCYPRWRVLFNA